jgi:hypothetical protein
MVSLFLRLPIALVPLALALVLPLFRRLPLARIALAHSLKLSSMFNRPLVIQAASADAFLDASFDSITHLLLLSRKSV